MVLSDKENKYSPGKVNSGWPIPYFTVNIKKRLPSNQSKVKLMINKTFFVTFLCSSLL